MKKVKELATHSIKASAAEKMVEAPAALRAEKLCTVGQMRVLDMHAHLSALSGEYAEALLKAARSRGEKIEPKQLGKYELEFRKKSGIATCLSAGTPEEWEQLKEYTDRRELLLSFGIHPWYADQYEPLQYLELFAHSDVVGEIGMDCAWCDVSLQRQQKNLEQQLQIAADLGKPVVLHTKGQEQEITEILKGFPNPILIHWYSGDLETFEKFLDMDCYFTLGPDLSLNDPLYSVMLGEVGIDRLFMETDGLSAVAWAKQMEFLDFPVLPSVLENNMALVAEQKEITVEMLHRKMTENLRRFLVSV